jgi:HAD superfamily hydrolase (TIGR01509 family)
LKIRAVVLDAMGVIYSVRDDVKDLLCPFTKEHIREVKKDRLQELYIAASLGKMSSYDFWKSVGVNPELEDEYLQRHRLTDGLVQFLEKVNANGIEAWCLSNDISQWSGKLRRRFGLEKYFKGFVISGDAGYRKPDAAIFQFLLDRINLNPGEILFVDDNSYNTEAAAKLGFQTVLFTAGHTSPADYAGETVNDFAGLLNYILKTEQ